MPQKAFENRELKKFRKFENATRPHQFTDLQVPISPFIVMIGSGAAILNDSHSILHFRPSKRGTSADKSER